MTILLASSLILSKERSLLIKATSKVADHKYAKYQQQKTLQIKSKYPINRTLLGKYLKKYYLCLNWNGTQNKSLHFKDDYIFWKCWNIP